METLPKKFRAPEIYGDYWFNSDPILIGASRGKVIVINFWDYTSLSSLQTLPYIKEWHRLYSEDVLINLGIHTPRFQFARDPALIGKMISKLAIRYPIVIDNDYIIWQSFHTRVWPTNFLIDKDGFIRYIQEAEGSYKNFEHAIQVLLAEAGYRGEFPLAMEPIRHIDRPGAIFKHLTPEIFAGYQGRTIGNVEGYTAESTIKYRDPGYYLEGRLYLDGSWFIGRNYVKLNDSQGNGGYVILQYQGKEVFVVVHPTGETKFQVFVFQDGNYLNQENKGNDIIIDNEGRSFFLASESKLYQIVKNPECQKHILKIHSRSNGFALYTVSFLSSIIPEFIFGR